VRESGWRIGYLSQIIAFDGDGIAERAYPELSPEWHAQRLAWYRIHHGRAAGAWVKACVGWTLADRLVRELRRRVNGIRKDPILPVWRDYAGVLRG
jgi:hypothetical protein